MEFWGWQAGYRWWDILPKKATPEQRLKEESCLAIWGKTVPGRGSSTCKGPEVEGA